MGVINETAFVVCSRINSSRIPKKAIKKINGVPLINHLISRLLKCNLPVILAVPDAELEDYTFLLESFPADKLLLYSGFSDNPMQRMYNAAKFFNVKNIIRVCHDKIFIDDDLVELALSEFIAKGADYLYSTEFTDGSAFEIISRDCLLKAVEKFKKAEHISYAIKAITNNTIHFSVPKRFRSTYRFLIDYPEDMDLMELILANCGNNCTLTDAILNVQTNSWMKEINRLPLVTVYTCAYNSAKYIEKAMWSVKRQYSFSKMEYILIDDHSTDDTLFKMALFAKDINNARWIRNSKNMGLASSSNIALNNARGKYLVRLDADDYFVGFDAIEKLVEEIELRGVDAIYPHNYFGMKSKIQHGWESHHVGGSIFLRRAVNHIKFTDKLRHYEGLDFFERAKDQLKIGYLNEPIFLYRQHKDSMSKNNLKERKKVKDSIDGKRNKSTLP